MAYGTKTGLPSLEDGGAGFPRLAVVAKHVHINRAIGHPDEHYAMVWYGMFSHYTIGYSIT